MPALRLKWEETASDELGGIIAYIAQDNPQAARRLGGEIKLQTGRLRQNPHLGRAGRVPGTRELVVRRNYIVVYAFTAETVTILRVRHAAMGYSS